MNRIFRSFKNSCNGLKTAWQEDQSFRTTAYQVIGGTVLATVIVAYWNEGILTWLLLVGSLLPIMIVETINSSIEAVTDKASPEKHPLAKKAKDIGSAAVLLTRVWAVICWIVGLIAI